MNNDSRDAALAMLAATYYVEPLPETAEPIVLVLPAKAVKPKKEKKGKKSAKTTANTSKSAALPINMPLVGSLNAQDFLLAFRDAGKRAKETVNEATGEIYIKRFFDASFVREDTIRAIHAFIGYDPSGDFGTQDIAARAKAQRDLRGGVVAAQFHRRGGASVSPSISGYIAGSPDYLVKRKVDLAARERLAVSECLRHLKNAKDADFVSPIGEASPLFMAALEEERLVEIRKDLDCL